MGSEPQSMLQLARLGEPAEVGKLLSSYTNYLKMLANAQLDRRVRQRVSPSDLVQETLMEAHRDFGAFRGQTDAELVGWLRRILINNLIRASERHLQTEKRDVRREVSLQRLGASLRGSDSRFDIVLADPIGTPSSFIRKEESARLLADALAELPADQYQVVMLRHVDGLPFNDIATQMNRSSGACRMLWLRAMDQLREKLQGRTGE